jgi:hypothetical protein
MRIFEHAEISLRDRLKQLEEMEISGEQVSCT